MTAQARGRAPLSAVLEMGFPPITCAHHVTGGNGARSHLRCFWCCFLCACVCGCACVSGGPGRDRRLVGMMIHLESDAAPRGPPHRSARAPARARSRARAGARAGRPAGPGRARGWTAGRVCACARARVCARVRACFARACVRACARARARARAPSVPSACSLPRARPAGEPGSRPCDPTARPISARVLAVTCRRKGCATSARRDIMARRGVDSCGGQRLAAQRARGNRSVPADPPPGAGAILCPLTAVRPRAVRVRAAFVLRGRSGPVCARRAVGVA